MIISRTPLRISFCGGGTDLPSYYQHYESGLVVSATINQYISVLVHPRFDDKIRFTSFKEEVVDSVEEMEQDIAREVLLELGIEKGIDVIAVSDVPPGTGMGSSGAFTVGLYRSLRSYLGRLGDDRAELAEAACILEIEKLQQPVGKQDQYAAAFGGFAEFEFEASGNVVRRELTLSDQALQTLQDHSMLFFLEKKRSASKILKAQVGGMEQKHSFLTRMKALVPDASQMLQSGDMKGLGELLDATWAMKKELAKGVSDPSIDELYQTALQAGAFGGKVLGAGGGGFLYFLVSPDKQESVRKALGLQQFHFSFENSGSILLDTLSA